MYMISCEIKFVTDPNEIFVEGKMRITEKWINEKYSFGLQSITSNYSNHVIYVEYLTQDREIIDVVEKNILARWIGEKNYTISSHIR